MRNKKKLEQVDKSNIKGQSRIRVSKNSKSNKKIKENKNNKNNKNNLKNKKTTKNKNKSWILIIICLFLGVGIGYFTEFNIKDFIEDISKYKITIVKVDGQSEELENDSKEDSKTNTSKKSKQSNKKSKQSNSDKINKAKKAIINSCGSEFKDVAYSGEGKHPTKRDGEYYIFNMGEDVTGDMMFYVEKDTYKVFEYSVDGYFGEYRRGDYSSF